MYMRLCLNLIEVKVTVTSEDVCWSIRNVKFINESFYMCCLVMFITAVCLIFLSPGEKLHFSKVITVNRKTTSNIPVKCTVWDMS